MRDFLKYTFASLLGLVLFCGLGVGGLIFLIVAAASQESEPTVKDKSVLVFDLSLQITDTQPIAGTSQLLSETLSGEEASRVTLRTVLDTLNKATQDQRIVGLYLHGGEGSTSTSSGLATLKEVREALERFRATGKPIIAYDMDWTEREYYLGSVASNLILNPVGVLQFDGFSSETTFLAGTLQKYGVGVQVTRAGKYKSAVEPFTRNQWSVESRQQTQKLLNDLWQEYLATVGKSRQLKTQQLQAIADNQGILLANDAVKQKLIDRVAYLDEVVTQLKELTNADETDETFPQISLKAYAGVSDASVGLQRNSDNQIAVVYAEGEIVDGKGGPRDVGGDRLARLLRELRQDESIKAVVLRVNSPGGSATASEVIQREIKLIHNNKPVIVSMGDLAASGGYWISTYADQIFAQPNTITGSIGVFGLSFDVQKLAKTHGVSWDVVKTARYADSQTPTRPKTPQELAIRQKLVDQIYNQFLNKVAESRKLPKQKVEQIAQGRVWSGVEAKKLGLVDQIGGLDSAVQEAAKRAKLGDDWQLKEYPQNRSLEEQILQRLISTYVPTQPTSTDFLAPILQQIHLDLAVLTTLNDPLEAYARLPYRLNFD